MKSAGIAQQERRAARPEVAGATPAPRSIAKSCASRLRRHRIARDDAREPDPFMAHEEDGRGLVLLALALVLTGGGVLGAAYALGAFAP